MIEFEEKCDRSIFCFHIFSFIHLLNFHQDIPFAGYELIRDNPDWPKNRKLQTHQMAFFPFGIKYFFVVSRAAHVLNL